MCCMCFRALIFVYNMPGYPINNNLILMIYSSLYSCRLQYWIYMYMYMSSKVEYTSISLSTQTPSICSLSHAHLLPVLGYSCDGPRLCLIYPYMANGSLDAHIKDHTHLTPRVRVQIACDVSSALAYLHCQAQQVVIHRDIKRYMYINSNTCYLLPIRQWLYHALNGVP